MPCNTDWENKGHHGRVVNTAQGLVKKDRGSCTIIFFEILQSLWWGITTQSDEQLTWSRDYYIDTLYKARQTQYTIVK
jgi:hypothetical protein